MTTKITNSVIKKVNTKSTLILAVVNNWYSVVEVLLRTGTNVHVESESALNYAVKDKNLEMIKLLVKYGADSDKLHPEAKNYYNHHYAKEINGRIDDQTVEPAEVKEVKPVQPVTLPFSATNFNPAGAKSRPTQLPGFRRLNPKLKQPLAPPPAAGLNKYPASFQSKTIKKK